MHQNIKNNINIWNSKVVLGVRASNLATFAKNL